MNDSATLSILTNASPGAVAILQLCGANVRQVLTQLTGRSNWKLQYASLAQFGQIDHGLVMLWQEDWAQLMPHGGPRVVQKLVDRLLELGVTLTQPATKHADARLLFPEASSQLEADMLQTIATAASPAAVDLLLRQPSVWQQTEAKLAAMAPEPKQAEVEAILKQSEMLDRLIHPPMVAVAGRPNVGKSSLTNAMLGRSASIVADLPGTTRDWVAGMAQLPSGVGAVSVRWLDTPGVHASDDHIEQQAIAMSRQMIQQADVVIAMCDPDSGWPVFAADDRKPDLWIMNKMDLHTADADEVDPSQAGRSSTQPLGISVKNATGLSRLCELVLSQLQLDSLSQARQPAWAFCDRLKESLRQGESLLC